MTERVRDGCAGQLSGTTAVPRLADDSLHRLREWAKAAVAPSADMM
jgi:hypothetical protein